MRELTMVCQPMSILSSELQCQIGLDLPLPALGSIWEHHESRMLYQVYDITNQASVKAKYPIMVSYRRLSDQTTWSRPLTLWYQDYSSI